MLPLLMICFVWHLQACDGTTMLWDYNAVLRIIHASRAVVAVICAHDHDGGYHRDAAGVHHLTLRSPLNRGAAGSAFGAVSVGGGIAWHTICATSTALASELPTLTIH